jgi:hypothetical protein
LDVLIIVHDNDANTLTYSDTAPALQAFFYAQNNHFGLLLLIPLVSANNLNTL